MIGRVDRHGPAEVSGLVGRNSAAKNPQSKPARNCSTPSNASNCHGEKAPTMAGLYGSKQRMADGSIIDADEQYLRESILDSTARVVAGYAPIMPSFRGQITEEQLMQLIAYIKSLRDPANLKKTD
jgi:cytochrome c oxidase subunit 2